MVLAANDDSDDKILSAKFLLLKFDYIYLAIIRQIKYYSREKNCQQIL